MTKEQLIDVHKDIPDIIESSIAMSQANSSIKIYEGKYLLKNNFKEIEVNGIINFDWMTSPGSYFSGEVQLELNDFKSLSENLDVFQIIVDGLEFGSGFIINTILENNTKSALIKGALSHTAILGDKSISVDKIRFSMPNLREFYGSPVKKVTLNSFSTLMGRLHFENDDYLILVDKCHDYRSKKNSLEEKGGYIILYYGELISKKGAVKLDDTKDIFYCFDTFITFLNGKRTSATFLQGIYSDKVIWSDFTDYFVDPHTTVTSWPQRHSLIGLNELWKNFSLLWKDPDDKNFLTSAIHWYIEANSNRGFPEGNIIIAQTALELLYNWWIIEQKKLIIGKDSENINASNKIRLLLSQLNISHFVPKKFTQLQQFIDESKDIVDAPDAITQIRNAIVHSQEEKRKKLSSIHYKVKYEVLQLCLWYIEMTLLRILDFNGHYFNRCSIETYASKAEERVPWAKKEIE